MLGQIDRNRKPEKSRLFLCKPNRQIIAELSEAYNKELKTSYNGIHEYSFTIPYKVMRQNKIIVNPNFHLIKGDYLIKYVKGSVEEYFVIDKPSNSGSDTQDKTVQCYLQPYQLRKKLVRNYTDTKKLYDPIGTDGFLNDTLIKKTNWSVGYVDSDLSTTYRTVDVTEQSLIQFIDDLCTAFDCIVVWDTKNRQVNFYKELNYGTDKGLLIEEGKYLKSISEEPDFDSVATRVYFYGKDDLTFNAQNPTGTDYLEDFSYYMYPFEQDSNGNVITESLYMSNGLCKAIISYQALVDSKQGQFADLMNQLTTQQTTLTTKQNELTQLQIDLAIIQDQIDVNKSLGNDVTDLQTQLQSKQSEIDAKQAEIDSVQSDIDNINSQIDTIKSEVAMENNFTSDQIVELNDFVHELTITQQYISDEKELYDFAKEEITKHSQPLIHYSMDIVDFTKVVQSQRDWDKLNYGDIIRVRYPKFNVDIKARIISVTHNEDDNSVSIEIANSNDINSGFLSLKDLYQKAASSSTTIDMSKYKWDKSEENADSIASMINADFDATSKRIIAGVDESVEISRRGIIIKNPSFPEEMLIAQSGVLALSQDGGNTWHTAIKPDRIVADLVMGKLIAGVNLSIQNESGLYTIDKDGFTIQGGALNIIGGLPADQVNLPDGIVTETTDYNGVRLDSVNGITVTSTKNVTTLNASKGIEIKRSSDNVILFSVDSTTGDLSLTGNINMTSGSIAWDSVGKPTYTATDVGALPSNSTKLTKIDANGVYTGTVTTDQITAGTAKISTALIDNLVVGTNVTMGSNATISWNQVTSQPYIPRTASDVGALSSTYIDANGVWTGKVTADSINGGTMTGTKWQSASDATPFEIYIGTSTRYKTFTVYNGAIHLYNTDQSTGVSTEVFRADSSGLMVNGTLFDGTAKFG